MPAHRHRDADRHIGDVPHPRGVHLEVFALPVHEFAAEQFADDLDGFTQHVLSALDGGPALADDVFVEVLAAAEAQSEPAVGEYLQGRGLLRDDGGVVSHRRAGDVGVQFDAFGGVSYRAQHRPGVGRVPLGGQPRREVVAADFEVETPFSAETA